MLHSTKQVNSNRCSNLSEEFRLSVAPDDFGRGDTAACILGGGAVDTCRYFPPFYSTDRRRSAVGINDPIARLNHRLLVSDDNAFCWLSFLLQIRQFKKVSLSSALN